MANPVFDSAPTLEKIPALLILVVTNVVVFVIPRLVVPLATVKPPPKVANPVFDRVPTLEKLPVLL